MAASFQAVRKGPRISRAQALLSAERRAPRWVYVRWVGCGAGHEGLLPARRGDFKAE